VNSRSVAKKSGVRTKEDIFTTVAAVESGAGNTRVRR